MDVENDKVNVVSNWFNVANINVEIDNVYIYLFPKTLRQPDQKVGQKLEHTIFSQH